MVLHMPRYVVLAGGIRRMQSRCYDGWSVSEQHGFRVDVAVVQGYGSSDMHSRVFLWVGLNGIWASCGGGGLWCRLA